MLGRLLIGLGGVLFLGASIHAGTLDLTAGSITSTAVFDTSVNTFVALDIRGKALITDGLTTDLLTDSFSGQNFGNLDLVDQNLGNATLIAVIFNPASMLLKNNFLDVTTTGLLISGGPLTALEKDFIAPAHFIFTLVSVNPVPGVQSQTAFGFDLTSITVGAVPEPTSLAMVFLGLAIVPFARRWRSSSRA